MDNIKGTIAGTVITLLIGGTAYTFTQEDVVKNFANDTGMSEQQAEMYVSGISEEELETFTVVGTSLITEGQELTSMANEIDCDMYEYEWQSASLSCPKGKTQLVKLAKDTSALGYAYLKLDSDSAASTDISTTITLIDQLNTDLSLEISKNLWESSVLEEEVKTNSYNKARLKAALETTQSS